MPFHKNQIEAIEHKEGPMMVLAGPGSGKTTVLTHRIKYLVSQCKVDPAHILVITFTKAATEEMKERFYHLVGEERLPVAFGTFHSIFFQILKRAYGYQGSNIAREEQRMGFLRALVEQEDIDVEDIVEFCHSILGEISLVKGEMLSLEHYYAKNCSETLFKKFYQGYESKMLQENLIDFDDMLVMCYELLKQRSDILSAWQKKFRYILVDEFQDINRVQYEIVRMLARPQDNLFIVGDDDQSIYRFRGAKPEIMLGFLKDYPQASQTLLGINYRSTSTIVETAKQLISNNKVRYEKEIYAAKGVGKPVTTECYEDEGNQAKGMIQMIQSYVKAGYQWEDIAVLFRTNMEPRILTQRLMEYNIPFQMRDVLPNMYEHWIAKDLLAYLRMAHYEKQRSDMLRIMNKPKRYISRDALVSGQVSMKELKRWYQDKPWMIERIEQLEFDLAMIKKMLPKAALHYIRKTCGYDKYLEEHAEFRRIDKDELFQIAEQLQESAATYGTVDDFFEHIKDYSERLKEKIEQKTQLKQGISLMTMHSAKGLEYPIVYIMDVIEGIIPYHKAVIQADIEEERRMFYVAMTRAKERLHICYVKERYGKRKERSRFIDEYQGL